MRGIASLRRISLFRTVRQPRTASTRLRRPYDAMAPDSMELAETKRMLVSRTRGANMGRAMMGSTVGMEALGSPCCKNEKVSITLY